MTKIISALIIAFWAVMTSLYLKQEVIPTLPELSRPSYETFLKNKTVSSETKMGIYLGNQRIGFTVTKVKTLPDGQHKISNYTKIKMFQLIGGTSIEMDGYTIVDQNFQLNSFEFKVASSVLNYQIKGVVEGNDMVIFIDDGREKKSRRIKDVSNSTLSNGFSPFLSMPNLSVGKEWTIAMMNPMDGTVEQVRAYVESKDTMEWKNEVYDVFEVVIDYKGFKPRAWITPDGRVLKEEVIMPMLYFLRE